MSKSQTRIAKPRQISHSPRLHAEQQVGKGEPPLVQSILPAVNRRVQHDPDQLGAADLLALQRTVGNRQVQLIMARRTRQEDPQEDRPEAEAPGIAVQKTSAHAGARSVSQLVSAKAAAYAHLHGFPGLAPGTVIQRSSSNGVSVNRMKFSLKDLPADGKTTSQAAVKHTGHAAGGATINWSIVGPALGTTIDATGLITPGAALPKGIEKVRIKIKAEDSKFPGANTHGYLTLWDANFLQAKVDYPKFLAQAFNMDPFTPGNFGKLAIDYRPRSRHLDATLRVSFTFVDDLAGAAKWSPKSKRAFEQKFISVVQNRWSNQYEFVNIREPQKIWQNLNPVRVRVRVRRDTKAPHQTITVHKKSVTAAVGVGGVRGQAMFGKGDDRSQPAFNPATGAAELAALAAVTPTPILFAAGKSDVPAADKGKLEFMATYLRRIKNPRFKLTITGHHQTVVHAPGAKAAQKRVANRQARKLSVARANEVRKILRAGKASFHQIRSRGVGDTGASATPAWDNVEITSALPARWRNVQTTLEHEAGHMLGIGDEYVSGGTAAGDKTSHYALTMQAFGKDYADVQARRTPDSASLMNGGNDIRPHHYVTLWDGLTQLTKAAPTPTTPFTQADWKFRGEE
jgi:outer membrane protein OmpA-like peptidoglycan-associated protein